MKLKYLTALGIFLMALTFLAIGCKSTPQETASADTAASGPKWVMKGSGAFDVDGLKVFYGVGLASGIKNKALLRQTADDRSRAEIAKTLEVYVSSLTKDYMASTTAGDMSKSSEEQNVETALKTFSKTTLHGAIIVDRWLDPADGTMYSLCELDLIAFKENLDKYNELDEKVRDYVRDNAEKMHDKLEEMERQ